jgi:uncharacterized RDD family membrane protein YckC
MARIQVETTQNVLLEFDLAGVGDRMIASIIDLFIALFYVGIGYLLASQVFGHEFFWNDSISISLHIIFWGPYFFYHWYMEFFLSGQTPGKRIMNIKVMKMDGAAPSFGDYFLRWMMRFLDNIFFIGIIAMAVSKGEQRIGDMAADTTVIRMKKRANLEDTVLKLISNRAYQPVFTNVLKFSDKDINLIKETVDHAKRTGNMERVVKLAQKVKELHPDIPHMAPLKTLEVLLYDYNYVAQKMGQ